MIRKTKLQQIKEDGFTFYALKQLLKQGYSQKKAIQLVWNTYFLEKVGR